MRATIFNICAILSLFSVAIHAVPILPKCSPKHSVFHGGPGPICDSEPTPTPYTNNWCWYGVIMVIRICMCMCCPLLIELFLQESQLKNQSCKCRRERNLSKNIRSPSSTTTLKVENHYREILRFAITKCVMYKSLFFSFLSLYIQHEIRYCSSKCKATKALEHSWVSHWHKSSVGPSSIKNQSQPPDKSWSSMIFKLWWLMITFPRLTFRDGILPH